MSGTRVRGTEIEPESTRTQPGCMQPERAKHGVHGCQETPELGQFREPSSSLTSFALHTSPRGEANLQTLSAMRAIFQPPINHITAIVFVVRETVSPVSLEPPVRPHPSDLAWPLRYFPFLKFVPRNPKLGNDVSRSRAPRRSVGPGQARDG